MNGSNWIYWSKRSMNLNLRESEKKRYTPWNEHSTWTLMVGILLVVSFWDGHFSWGMLVSGRVTSKTLMSQCPLLVKEAMNRWHKIWDLTQHHNIPQGHWWLARRIEFMFLGNLILVSFFWWLFLMWMKRIIFIISLWILIPLFALFLGNHCWFLC